MEITRTTHAAAQGARPRRAGGPPPPAVPPPLPDSYVPAPVPASLQTPVQARVIDADLRLRLDASPAGAAARVGGSLDGRVSVSGRAILKTLRQHMPAGGDLRFEKFYFDAARGEYRIEGQKILSERLGRLNPNFAIRLRPDGAGRLIAQAEAPLGWLVKAVNAALGVMPFRTTPIATPADALHQKLDGALDRDLFRVSREGDQTVIDLVPRLQVPLGRGTVLAIEAFTGARSARFNAVGDLEIDLRRGKFAGRVGKPGSAGAEPLDPSRADLRLRVAIGEGPGGALQAETLAEGELTAHTTRAQLQAMGAKLPAAVADIGKEADLNLKDLRVHSRYGNGQPLRNRMSADALLTVDDGRMTLQGKVRADETDRQNWRLEAEQVIADTDAAPPSQPSRVAVGREGARTWVDVAEPPAPVSRPRLSPNRLELIVDGPNYVRALTSSIRAARESVTIESYGFEGNTQPQSVMLALLHRAAGLAEQGGQVRPDGGRGVQVKILADKDRWWPGLWPEEVVRYLKHRGEQGWEAATMAALDGGQGRFAGLSGNERDWYRKAYAWTRKFADDLEQGRGAYAAIPAPARRAALANATRNVDARQSGKGLGKSDHRKLAVIDGAQGFTGGMNMGDWNLDRAHDVMIRVQGPAAREIQQRFVQAWDESGPHMPATERRRLLKPAAQLQAPGGSPAAVLVTDSDRNEIEQALGRHIDGARRRINVEHVFFAYPPITAKLAAAVRRGVDVNVVMPVPEETVGDLDGSQPFLFANIDAAQQLLLAAQQPGAGKVNVGFYPRTMHTKAMSFDGRSAIVGSANLDARGLHGALRNFLFNRELDLLVEDPRFVAELDRRVMDADRRGARSWAAVLQELHAKHGGPAGLQREIEKRRGRERFY